MIEQYTYRFPDNNYQPRHHAAPGRESAVDMINRLGSPELRLKLFYATVGNQPAA